jgi:hypothetical protein
MRSTARRGWIAHFHALVFQKRPKADQLRYLQAEICEGNMASRLMRLLASGLILNATFLLGALAATTPVSVAQPAPAQPFNAE